MKRFAFFTNKCCHIPQCRSFGFRNGIKKLKLIEIELLLGIGFYIHNNYIVPNI